MNLRSNWKAALSLTGTILKWLAIALCIPLVVAVYFGDSIWPFVIPGAISLTLGLLFERIDPDPHMNLRDGFLMLVLAWVFIAFIGSFPYLISTFGTSSSLSIPINALFESVSGFTTTGATVIEDLSSPSYSKSILFWRQFTQWLGGMGIIVLALAIIPSLSSGGMRLLDAESPGPGVKKLTPKIAETARFLWIVYLGITFLEILALYGLHVLGLAPNMDFYNAVCHGMTTLASGGFSPAVRGIETFSAAVQWVIIPFMVASGTNFALFYKFMSDDKKVFLKDSEFKYYLLAIAALCAIFLGIFLTTGTSIGIQNDSTTISSFRSALFLTVSLITTTGYVNFDYTLLDLPIQYLILLAMFIGGSVGSTSCSIKILRWVIILKSVKSDIIKIIHPDAVVPVRFNNETLTESTIKQIHAFTLLFIFIFGISTILISLDSYRIGLNLSLLEAMGAVAATLGNFGPSFGQSGPMGTYLHFSTPSKLYMSGLMIAGRLEIFPLIVLFTRVFWKS
jgi:trk system potassium uptake protein TrkH